VSRGGYHNNVLEALFSIAGHKIHAVNSLVLDGQVQALEIGTPVDWERWRKSRCNSPRWRELLRSQLA
jgi:hypothetical protein